MDGTKGLLASRTVIGLLVVLLAQGSDRLFGTDLAGAAELQREIVGYVSDLVSLGGIGLALWGRIAATKRIAGALLLVNLAQPIGAVGLALGLGACGMLGSLSSDPAGALGAALAKADVGVARAKDYAQVVCAHRTTLFAVAQTAMALAKASDAAWADERKAEGELIALCEDLPSNTAEVLPTILRLKARIEGAASS